MSELVPPSALQTLDASFLEARARLLELAAIFDRIDRGPGRESLSQDVRLLQLRQGVEQLLSPAPGRAEAVQQLFSLTYDPNWIRPDPSS